MTNTKTKKEMFTEIQEYFTVAGEEEKASFIAKEIELLNKKASYKSERKAKDFSEDFEKILNVMQAEPHRLFRVNELVGLLNLEFSSQKITQRLKNLIADGKVEKVVDKGVSYFKIGE